MEWVKVNESPVGYEPIYTVLEKNTGREVASNLEKDEACIIENSRELYDLCIASKEYLDEYYMKDDFHDKETLRVINTTLTKIEILLTKIEREINV